MSAGLFNMKCDSTVGAGLPAIAAYQPPDASTDRLLSQASQLPH
ncbi:hypothetical protein C4K03_1814 [Pseudomonas synxantha]|uniref:Uncharacterized protein n=1 Tax=Pseudomonas synxantha TaxID=47883 RepID=A0A3G7U3N5_9PSED|nr:hypothetical protein C4K03_1814 [Pseudomonas synxantha]